MPRSTNTQSACSTNTRFSPSCLPVSSYATPFSSTRILSVMTIIYLLDRAAVVTVAR
jgi:hypothetical protein